MRHGKILALLAAGVGLAGCSSLLLQCDEPRIAPRPPNPTWIAMRNRDATEAEAAATDAADAAAWAERSAAATERKAAEIKDDTWKKLASDARRLAIEGGSK